MKSLALEFLAGHWMALCAGVALLLAWLIVMVVFRRKPSREKSGPGNESLWLVGWSAEEFAAFGVFGKPKPLTRAELVALACDPRVTLDELLKTASERGIKRVEAGVDRYKLDPVAFVAAVCELGADAAKCTNPIHDIGGTHAGLCGVESLVGKSGADLVINGGSGTAPPPTHFSFVNDSNTGIFASDAIKIYVTASSNAPVSFHVDPPKPRDGDKDREAFLADCRLAPGLCEHCGAIRFEHFSFCPHGRPCDPPKLATHEPMPDEFATWEAMADLRFYTGKDAGILTIRQPDTVYINGQPVALPPGARYVRFVTHPDGKITAEPA